MKHETSPPKGTSTATTTTTVLVTQSSCSAAQGPVTETKSIFDISNDELMNFLSGNNESLNFLDIKEPAASTPDPTTTTTSDRPRRTSRKAWVSSAERERVSARLTAVPPPQSVSDMTDSGSQSDETTSGTTSTGCGVDQEEEGSDRYRRKRERRTGGGDNGSKVTGSGQRKKKGVLNAKERNMRRLESNERERKRMHDLNNQFQVRVGDSGGLLVQ